MIAIPVGRKNAIKLEGRDNRRIRREINKANIRGEIIINNGYGYFKPDLNDKGDEAELNHYLASELHRAREILYKRQRIKEAMSKKEN